MLKLSPFFLRRICYHLTMIEFSQSFCVAPWLHAHISANGSRRLCCVAKQPEEDLSSLSWEEFKNSEYLKKTRKLMLAGRTVSDCRRCDNADSKNTYKSYLNKLYENEIKNILKSTDIDGSTSFPTMSVDYRKKICNLKCQTCSPFSSSSYNSFLKQKKAEEYEDLFLSEMKEIPSYKKIMLNFDKEFSSHLAAGHVNLIYFAGGEPLLDPQHFTHLKQSLSINPQINLTYNTNLMIAEETVKNWVELLNQFNSLIIIRVSLDGLDEIGKYIRKGIDLSQIDKNINYIIKNKNENIKLELDMTLTSLGFFNLVEMMSYAAMKKISLLIKPMIGGEKYFPLLRPEKTPLELRKKILTNWREKFSSLSIEDKKLLIDANEAVESMCVDLPFEKTNSDDLDRLKKIEKLFDLQDRFFELLKSNSTGKLWADELTQLKNKEPINP